jgi:molybdopterin-containing oxidoreductase family iron-sulfur binding subunit
LWKSQKTGEDFERFWRKSLHDGLIAGSALSPKQVTLKMPVDNDQRSADSGQRSANTESAGMETVFRMDPHIHDGRFANNGWLQELPKPLTKLTWDNAALVSPRTAERLDASTDSICAFLRVSSRNDASTTSSSM